ncbi:hypothetical protein, partial [Staphylococcus aureus]|uniref:hypothetical protein n=1 Tax=Staphylococcus aureus TaxID=1280 RepID=UPI0038B3DBE7
GTINNQKITTSKSLLDAKSKTQLPKTTSNALKSSTNLPTKPRTVLQKSVLTKNYVNAIKLESQKSNPIKPAKLQTT